MSDSQASPSGPAKPKRPLLFPSRIILLALLAVAVGALVYDYSNRYKRSAAFKVVNALLPSDEEMPEMKFNDRDLTPENVQSKLGRAPDEVSELPDKLEEIYRWPGIFHKYPMKVSYLKAGKTLKPMLQGVAME